MDNVSQPWERDPRTDQPIQPYRFTPGWPAGPAEQGQPGPAHGQVPPGYGQAPPGYGQAPPGYGQAPPEHFGQPPPGYGQVPPGHSGQAPPGYGQAPLGYGEATTRFGQLPPDYYQGIPGQPGRQNWPRRTRSRRVLRWGAGITAAALLGAGGALAGLKLTGNGPAPANSALASALNNALSPAGSASCGAAGGSSAGSSSAGQAGPGRRHCHSHRLRLLRLVQGMYGQLAFYTPHGTETLAFERGMVESVSGNSVVVRARNGTTWTWTLASNSIIRKQASAATSSDLSAGERVFVGGLVSGSTRDIRLILIRRPGLAGSAPVQPGSQGAQPGSGRSSSARSPAGTFTLPPH